MDTKRATLLSVAKFLKNNAYRAQCLTQCQDHYITDFWRKDFQREWGKSEREAALIDLETRLGKALSLPVFRNIVGQQESTFSFRPGAVVIANLNRSKIGDTAALLLGSLIAARARAPVYINDFSFFASDQLVSLLPRGGYTITLQFLDELATRKQQNAVLAIQHKYVFRTNLDDAEKLSFHVGVLNPREIVDPTTDTWHTNQPHLFEGPRYRGRLRAVRSRSRAVYTRPKRKVEADILRHLG